MSLARLSLHNMSSAIRCKNTIGEYLQQEKKVISFIQPARHSSRFETGEIFTEKKEKTSSHLNWTATRRSRQSRERTQNTTKIFHTMWQNHFPISTDRDRKKGKVLTDEARADKSRSLRPRMHMVRWTRRSKPAADFHEGSLRFSLTLTHSNGY